MQISKVHMLVFCFLSQSLCSCRVLTSVPCLSLNKYLQTGSKLAINPCLNQGCWDMSSTRVHLCSLWRQETKTTASEEKYQKTTAGK